MFATRSFVLKSCVPAALGCWLGYQWGLAYGSGIPPGLYATGGAATVLLAVRLTSLLVTITRDFVRPHQ